MNIKDTVYFSMESSLRNYLNICVKYDTDFYYTMSTIFNNTLPILTKIHLVSDTIGNVEKDSGLGILKEVGDLAKAVKDSVNKESDVIEIIINYQVIVGLFEKAFVLNIPDRYRCFGDYYRELAVYTIAMIKHIKNFVDGMVK